MTASPLHLSTFTIERRLPASPERVFAAFASAEGKQRWFVGPPGWELIERTMDFRAGGREVVRGRFPDGKDTHFAAHYHEIRAPHLIVYAYDMYASGQKLSVSLASLQFRADGEGTHLLVTEQGAYFGDGQDALMREHGTGWLMDVMARTLPA